ncbi:UNVERIFIED_CONTAM: hypothetical protein Scaly_0475900 [Sesamum calycinum]|uniref:Reverse transcriptase/retrotransposon-derived protein RNase H-like domain-containing protein n=1 Tax=Sesamum calycinum TaxID=2727403 RepID=A0AAW2SHL9_9LAMI
MLEPRNIQELKSLQGKLAYLRRFISNLVGRCQPFSCLMKKDVLFQWDETCDKAFKSIKSYLMKPPVLVTPVPGRPLILYVAAQERSIGILLAQKTDDGKENALYYLSRAVKPNELKYSPIEKLCQALILSIQKLKHYFQSHSIHIVSKANPLKYVITKPVLSDRLANFLADHPMPVEWEFSDDLSDEDVLVIEVTPPWKTYFDGTSHKEGAGAGVVFVTSKGEVLPYAFTLTENCSNNIAKYQTLILGLEIAIDAKQLPLKVYGDSQANEMARRCKTRASTKKKQQTSDNEDETFQEEENHVMEVFEVEEEDWRQPLVDYLKYGKLPNDLRWKTDTR